MKSGPADLMAAEGGDSKGTCGPMDVTMSDKEATKRDKRGEALDGFNMFFNVCHFLLTISTCG